MPGLVLMDVEGLGASGNEGVALKVCEPSAFEIRMYLMCMVVIQTAVHVTPVDRLSWAPRPVTWPVP